MIGLDTNIIVRYLVQDDPKQSERANQLIEQAIQTGTQLSITHVTLCETVWVLERSYQLPKHEILHILNELVQTPELLIENEDIVLQAIQDFEASRGVGFADCLIGRQNLSNGCSITYTFDKKAANLLPKTYKLL